MKNLILFHRLMFIGVLIAAFFAGALDAGRRDFIKNIPNAVLVSLSLKELAELRVS